MSVGYGVRDGTGKGRMAPGHALDPHLSAVGLGREIGPSKGRWLRRGWSSPYGASLVATYGPPAHPRRLLRTGGTSPRAARRPRERGASPSGLPLMGPQCSACPARPGILLGEGCAPRTPAGRGLGLVLRPWVGPPARHHPQALQARPSECLGAEGRGQAKSGWPPQGEWAGNALALAARPATPVDSRTRDPSP